MKKLFSSIALILSFSVHADPIPKPVENVIKVYKYNAYSLENGKLTISLLKQKITGEMAQSIFQGICDTQFLGSPWKESAITKMAITNLSGDETITMNGGGSECKKMGPMKGDEAQAYLNSLIRYD